MSITGVGFAWWAVNLPTDARALIFPADGLLRATHLLGLITLGLLAALLVVVGFLAPRAFGVTAGILAIVLTGTYFGAYERVREGSRKPYIIHGYMYSNGVRVDEVDRLNREGILTKARWAGVGLAASPTPLGQHVSGPSARCATA